MTTLFFAYSEKNYYLCKQIIKHKTMIMKKHFLTLSLVCFAFLINAQNIDNQLLDEMNRRADDDEIEVVVVMKDRYDRTLLNQKADAFATRAERRDFVVPRAPQLEETPETPPSSRAEGLLFLHGLESNPGSSLQTEEEAGLP